MVPHQEPHICDTGYNVELLYSKGTLDDNTELHTLGEHS